MLEYVQSEVKKKNMWRFSQRVTHRWRGMSSTNVGSTEIFSEFISTSQRLLIDAQTQLKKRFLLQSGGMI